MNINKYDFAMMDVSERFSKLSYAIRRKVGATLVRDKRIIINGYNGTIEGTSNRCEDIVGFRCPHCNSASLKIDDLYDISATKNHISYKCRKCGVHTNITENIVLDDYNNISVIESAPNDFKELVTNDFVLHAEQNIICYAAKKGIPIDGCDLYVTLSPCKNCAKLIAQSGIRRVYFKELYRDDSGIKFLENLGIRTIQIKD